VPARFTGGALSLAVVSIFGRRLASMPGRSPEMRRVLEITGLVAAAAIAAVGVVLAFTGGDRQDALLLVLGAAILSLRRPASAPAS
jgi:hypothetical protein